MINSKFEQFLESWIPSQLEKEQDTDDSKNVSAENQEYMVTIEDSKPETINYKGTTIQEILNLYDKTKANRYKFNSIQCYDIDIELYEDIVEHSADMQKTIEEGTKFLSIFKYLHQDIFLSLYKYQPVMIPVTKMHISTRLNRKIMGLLINTPQYLSLRQSCRFDEFNAALGTEILGAEALKILQDVFNSLQDSVKNQLDSILDKDEQMDSILEDTDEMIEELIEDMKTGAPIDEDQIQAAKNAMANGSADEQSAQVVDALANQIALEEQELDDLIDMDDIADDITKRLSSSVSDTTSQIQEISELCEVWGLGSGSEIRVAYDNKKAAIETIRSSKKLKSFTDIIGRFKETAIVEQKKKAKYGAVEIKGVTLSDKIEDALPSEKLNLCNEITKKDTYRRITEHQLLSYSKDSSKQKNKGPIIVCLDTSGSMYGDQEVWSKGLTIGILEVAQLQKRDFACIIYSDKADEPIIIRKDEINPEKVIRCAETFHDSGTNFERPLRKALKLIEDSTFREADIVFITDGDCGVSDSFLKEFQRTKENKNFKTLGVLVNIGGHTASHTLDKFCDSVTAVSDIADLTDSNSAANTSIFDAL